MANVPEDPRGRGQRGAVAWLMMAAALIADAPPDEVPATALLFENDAPTLDESGDYLIEE